MAAPKRTKIERERDLTRSADMYLARMTQAQIAAEIGVTQQVIARDIQEIIRRWQGEQLHSVSEYVARELAAIDAQERRYLAAWERSCMPRKRTVQEQRDTDGPGGGAVRTVRREDEERDGNPAFMAGIDRCVERRCKLLGLDAPEQVDLSVYVREKALELGLDPEEALREAEAVLRGDRAGGSFMSGQR